MTLSVKHLPCTPTWLSPLNQHFLSISTNTKYQCSRLWHSYLTREDDVTEIVEMYLVTRYFSDWSEYWNCATSSSTCAGISASSLIVTIPTFSYCFLYLTIIYTISRVTKMMPKCFGRLGCNKQQACVWPESLSPVPMVRKLRKLITKAMPSIFTNTPMSNHPTTTKW